MKIFSVRRALLSYRDKQNTAGHSTVQEEFSKGETARFWDFSPSGSFFERTHILHFKRLDFIFISVFSDSFGASPQKKNTNLSNSYGTSSSDNPTHRVPRYIWFRKILSNIGNMSSIDQPKLIKRNFRKSIWGIRTSWERVSGSSSSRTRWRVLIRWSVVFSLPPTTEGRVLLRPPKPQRHVGGGQPGKSRVSERVWGRVLSGTP